MLHRWYCSAPLVYCWLQSSGSEELHQLDSEQSHLNGKNKDLTIFFYILTQTLQILIVQNRWRCSLMRTWGMCDGIVCEFSKTRANDWTLRSSQGWHLCGSSFWDGCVSLMYLLFRPIVSILICCRWTISFLICHTGLLLGADPAAASWLDQLQHALISPSLQHHLQTKNENLALIIRKYLLN